MLRANKPSGTRWIVFALTVLALVAMALPLSGAATAAQARPAADIRHGARLAGPAVVRLITIETGQVICKQCAPNGSDFVFPGHLHADQSVYSLAWTGSGAFVSPDGYILTADHVVNVMATDQEYYLQMAADDIATTTGVSQADAETFLQYHLNSGHIEVPMEVAKRYVFMSTAYTGDLTSVAGVIRYEITRVVANSPVDQQDVAIVKIEAHDMPFLTLATATNVAVQDEVTALAYPADADVVASNSQTAGWLALLDPTKSDPNSLTNLLTSTQETGQVTKQSRLEDGTLVYETKNIGSYGSSGGPVINTNGQIIGFVDAMSIGADTGRVMFLVPSDVVTSYVKQAGITGTPTGALMSLWSKAVNEYEATGTCHWTKAAADLKKLQTDYPQFAAVQPLLKTAQSNVTPTECPAPNPVASMSPFIWVGIGVAALLVIGGLVAFFVMRGRRRPSGPSAPQPIPGIGPVPAGTPPEGGAPPMMPRPTAPTQPVGPVTPASPTPTPVASAQPASPATPTSSPWAVMASGAQAPESSQPAASAEGARTCANGHVLADPAAHFCPECGAPVTAATVDGHVSAPTA